MWRMSHHQPDLIRECQPDDDIIIAALVTQLPNLWLYRAGLMLLGIYDIYINPKWRNTEPIFKKLILSIFIMQAKKHYSN